MANMDAAVGDMTRQDIWDDSALVQSWNEALAEYKKYHSIHASGRSLDEVLSENEQRANFKPETHLHQHGQSVPRPTNGQPDEAIIDGQETTADTATAGGATNMDRVDRKENQDLAMNSATEPDQGIEHASASMMPSPQALLGSVQDEGLKKLLMSWYYAGFYTGLYEGQRQHRDGH